MSRKFIKNEIPLHHFTTSPLHHFIVVVFSFFSVFSLNGQNKSVSNSDFEYEDCSCAIPIELTIYNGLYGNYGGHVVPATKKVTPGAVTVANKNNTDGDVDVNSIDITDNTDQSVVIGTKGRNEVDLMKLEIKIQNGAPQTNSAICRNVELMLKGPIKLWKNSTKGTAQNNIIPISTLPLTIWVEATAESSAVRDIEIEAVINGQSKDLVKATAIWVGKKMVYNKTGNRTIVPDPVNLGIDQSMLLMFINGQSLAVDFTKYGHGSFNISPNIVQNTDFLYGNRVLFEFELLPKGIEKELQSLGIKYDIARQIETDTEYLLFGATKPISSLSKPFPMQVEEANDDVGNLDEDLVPNTINTSAPMDRIFSYDTPSEGIIGQARAYTYKFANFKEFVRVSFGNPISGNIQEGSRCSDYYNWEANYALISDSTIGNNPHDASQKLLTPTAGGNNLHCVPRSISATLPDGSVTISSVSTGSSSYISYLIRLNAAGDTWELVELGGGAGSTTQSNTSSTGPWNISNSNVTVDISNGSVIPFVPNDRYLFSIFDLPEKSKNNSFMSN